MSAAMRLRRLTAGEYWATAGDHFWIVSHRVLADDGSGYGRRDDWIVSHYGRDAEGRIDNGYADDPYATLSEARKGLAAWVSMLDVTGEPGDDTLRMVDLYSS